MSKAQGRNIIIKFTDDLVGDISDNINAFTVTGKEYQWVDGPDNNGPLLGKEYVIDKIERYGIVPIWSIEEELQLVLGNEPIDTSYSDINAIPLMTSDITIGVASASTIDGSLYSAYRAMDKNNGTYWSTTSSGKYPSWIRYKFTEPIMIGKYSLRARHNGGNGSPRNFVFQGLGTDGNWVDLDVRTGVSGWVNGELREFEVAYPGIYQEYRIYITLNDGRSYTQISEWSMFELIEVLGYAPTHQVELDPVPITGGVRVKWLEDKPTNTHITIEYTTGQSQGEWIEISNGDVITSDTNLWFRVTLETTDTSITPTLQDLWIEPDAPQDKIRIVFDDYSRFPSVIGDITVEYDASLGNLAGSGGAVESFIETFTPTGLVAEPNPGHVHTLSVAPASLEVDLLPIEYIDRFAEETDLVTVAPATLEVELIHIDVINP